MITMDSIDWDVISIEAGLGGVSPETARAVVQEADELLNRPDVTVEEIKPAARAVLALLKRHVPPPMQASPDRLAPASQHCQLLAPCIESNLQEVQRPKGNRDES